MLPCVGLHALALSYCSAYLTDGFLPHNQIPRLAGDLSVLLPEGEPWGLVKRLIEAGLWEEADGGFTIHDFLDYNPSKRETLQLRKLRAKSGQAGGQASAQAKSKQNQSKA